MTLTACPKCVAENGPKGRWDALTAVEGGVTCRYHGFMSVAEISRSFGSSRGESSRLDLSSAPTRFGVCSDGKS